MAYIEALVGAAPYYRTTDPRAKLVARFTKAFNEFNKQDDLLFDQYVAPKLRAWFSQFPPSPRVAGAADDADTEGGCGRPGGGAGAEGEDGEEEEAYALSGDE